jgi:hypothetical protein
MVSVRVRVTHRGTEIAGDGVLRVDEDAVRILASRRQVRAAYERLTGITYAPPRLTLHVSTGDVIEAEGDEPLDQVAAAIDARVCTIPELTRALRGLGGAAAAAGAAHDILFAPLLDARRAAEGCWAPNERMMAFDAPALRRAVERAIGLVASSRHPSSAPHRRALEAILLEEADPLFETLGRLETAAAGVRASDESRRFAAWREWVAAARRAFEAADRAWHPITRALEPR